VRDLKVALWITLGKGGEALLALPSKHL